MPRIADFRVSTDQHEPCPPVNTKNSCRIKLLPPFCSITGSNVPVCRKETAVMESQFGIGEPDGRSVILPIALHAA